MGSMGSQSVPFPCTPLSYTDRPTGCLICHADISLWTILASVFVSCNFMSCIFTPRAILTVRHFHVLHFQSIRQNLMYVVQFARQRATITTSSTVRVLKIKIASAEVGLRFSFVFIMSEFTVNTWSVVVQLCTLSVELNQSSSFLLCPSRPTVKPGFHHPSWRPELTALVDGFHYPSTRAVLRGARFH